MRGLLLLCCAICSSGCGLHMNRTVSRTLPYHAHQAELASGLWVEDRPLQRQQSRVHLSVSPFVAYYPLPVGIPSSGGKLPEAPERFMALELARAVGASRGGDLRVRAVVTDVQWYASEDHHAGRVSSLLSVTDRRGAVVFEAERLTTGRVRGGQIAPLLREHLRQWLGDPQLRRILELP